MRTVEEIQAEYGQVAAQLGDCTYRMSVFEEDARKLKRKLRQLNIEAAQLQAAAHNKQLEEEKNGKADDASSTETT